MSLHEGIASQISNQLMAGQQALLQSRVKKMGDYGARKFNKCYIHDGEDLNR